MASGAFICGARQLAGKTNLAKLLAQQLKDVGITLQILDASQAWNGFVNTVRFMPDYTEVQADFLKSNVFDMSAVGYAQRISIANQVCAAVLKMHVVDGYTNPEAVIFEECQTYIPNGCMRSLDKYGPIVDYVTVGGNFHTSFLAVTQFPAAVDKAIVKAAQQRYFGLTTEKNDVNYIRSFFEKGKEKELEAQLRCLNRGEFLYQNKGTTQKIIVPKYVAPRADKAMFSFTFENGVAYR